MANARDVPPELGSELCFAVTAGEPTSYSCRRGPYRFRDHAPVASDPGHWVRVKDTGGDRAIGPWDIRRHIAGTAEYATRIDSRSGIVVADVDLHMDRVPERLRASSGDRLRARVNDVTQCLATWARASGGRPLVMTSPGGGYHVWFRLDRLSDQEAVAACRRDFSDFLTSRGTRDLGADPADVGTGIDWFPRGSSHVRLPCGRGQVAIDDLTMTPIDGHGTRARRRVPAHVITLQGWFRYPARVRTVGAIGLTTDVPGPRPRATAWDLACATVRGTDDPEPRSSGRWDVGTLEPRDRLVVMESLPLQHDTQPTRVMEPRPRTGAQVELPGTVICGSRFLETMQAVESNGVRCRGSVSEFSAAVKLAFRARGLGVDPGLYVERVIHKSDVTPEQAVAIRATFHRSVERGPRDGSQRPGSGVDPCTVDPHDVVVPSTLPDLLRTIAPSAGHLGPLVLATCATSSEPTSSKTLREVGGTARVPGTSCLAVVAARDALVSAGLLTCSTKHRKAVRSATWSLTIQGWVAMIVAEHSSPETSSDSTKTVPDSLGPDIWVQLRGFGITEMSGQEKSSTRSR